MDARVITYKTLNLFSLNLVLHRRLETALAEKWRVAG